MKWLFNECGRNEMKLSLLAAGALAEAERARVEDHVARCASCRTKLVELQNLARGLTEAGRRLPEVEAPASLRRRWMMAVRAAAAGSAVMRPPAQPVGGFLHDGWFGRRLAWGGLAAMWALVLFLRFSAPDAPKPASLAGAPPVSLREVLLALKVEALPAQFRADAGRPQPQPPRSDALPPRRQVSPVLVRDSEVA